MNERMLGSLKGFLDYQFYSYQNSIDETQGNVVGLILLKGVLLHAKSIDDLCFNRGFRYEPLLSQIDDLVKVIEITYQAKQ